jgi:hypothetical protein
VNKFWAQCIIQVSRSGSNKRIKSIRKKYYSGDMKMTNPTTPSTPDNNNIDKNKKKRTLNIKH